MSDNPTSDAGIQTQGKSTIPLSCATSSLPPFPASSESESCFNLPSKLRAISKAGFQGIELAFPDLIAYASQFHGKDVGQSDFDDICQAAQSVRDICTGLGLNIIMLQPFAHWEGWEAGSKEKKDAQDRADGWIRTMQAVGTDMIQVGSSDAPHISSNRVQLAQDLSNLADQLARHNFKLCYENWCWATHAPTWMDVYELMELTSRSNIGLCLDTFQTAGYEWGDPTTHSGRREAPLGSHSYSLDDEYRQSLEKLSKTIRADQIYVIQVSDAYMPPKPMKSRPDEDGMRPRARWSMSFRPMPGTEGGYLPIIDFGSAVLKTGFRGWFSLEIFDGGPDGSGLNISDVNEWAKKCHTQLSNFVRQCERPELYC